MRKLKFLLEPNANLNRHGFEKKVSNFIKKRISIFFSDYEVQFSTNNDLNLHDDDIVVLLLLTNPIFDEILLKNMIESAISSKKIIKSEGAIPGTAPEYVFLGKKSRVQTESCFLYTDMQSTYNSQFNLSRMKRVIIFNELIQRHKSLYKWSLKDIAEYFSSKEGVELILSYTSKEKMIYFNSCPSCKSKDFTPLTLDDGNTATGFLTKFSVYYYQCYNCEIVFLNPTLPDEELYVYYDNYSYPIIDEVDSLRDHYSKLSRENVSTFYNFRSIISEVNELSENSRALDIGGGIGEYCVYLRKNYPFFKIELMDYRIDNKVKRELNKYDVTSKSLNFLLENIGINEYDLISNWEVIEHLPIQKLKLYFKKIRNALTKDGIYVLSTPDFSNPYSKALGFWSAFPGEHLSVLSRKSLEPILNKSGLYIFKEYHESVTLDFADRWFSYGADTNSTQSSRAQALIINDFLKDKKINNLFKDFRRKNNIGSEIILCMKKISYEK